MCRYFTEAIQPGWDGLLLPAERLHPLVVDRLRIREQLCRLRRGRVATEHTPTRSSFSTLLNKCIKPQID
eukprot:COSAG04_NODE_17026_length_481_cov_1.337696_1_plen_69_part_01